MQYEKKENLHIIYNATVNEITRYRDREWLNMILFTGAMAGIIGWHLSNGTINTNNTRPFFNLFSQISLIILAAANIYYTTFAHIRLAKNRKRQHRLELELGIENFKIDPEGKYFFRGFCNHLLPFFLVNLILAGFGIYIIPDEANDLCTVVIASVVLTFIVVGALIWDSNKYREWKKSMEGPIGKE